MAEEYQKKLEELRKKYHDKVAERTSKLNEVLNKAKATYDDANDYSIKTGETLSETLLNGITDDLIFDGKLPYGAAKEIIFPMIHDNYELITKYCEGVQNALNEQANIHLKYVKPEFDKDRAYGIINGIFRDDYEKIKNSFLGENIINQSQDIVTESVKANAKFQSETGMRPKIVRTVAGGCCDWCANLAGTYDYETVKATGNDVWRRHRYCRCTVTYVPISGKKKNVWTKKTIEDNEFDKKQKESQIEIAKITDKIKSESIKRFQKYSNEWHEASLKEAIDKFTPEDIITETLAKIIHSSTNSNYEVVEDKYSDYFRIKLKNYKGNEGKSYVGINGENVHNIKINGKIRGTSKEEYAKLTHFINSDKKEEK